MLLVDLVIIKACKAGTNLAEQHQVGTRRKQMASGKVETVPDYGGVYANGYPADLAPLAAPCDLLTGDAVRITADLEAREVWDVTRGGKVVYRNDPLQADEAAKQKVQLEKQELRDKLR